MRALIDNGSIIIWNGGETLIVSASDVAYPAVRNYLEAERGNDFDAVRELIDGIREPVRTAVADTIAVVDGQEGSQYRVSHGDPVEEIVLAAAVRIARESGSSAPLGAFLQRLERNPSQAARSQLFGWLKAGGFTITTDGLIVAYKSVSSDGLSANSGVEPVTVRHQDGRVEVVTGRVPYPVGAHVSMPRELVNDNRNEGCSVGIHAGTHSYARSYADDMLIVLIDPADVVSVPADCHCQKMRVCALYVAARHDGEQISAVVIDHIRTVHDPEAAAEYAARPENYRPEAYDDEDYDESDDDDDYDEDDQAGASSGCGTTVLGDSVAVDEDEYGYDSWAGSVIG